MKPRLKNAKRTKLYSLTMWAVAAALTVGSAGTAMAAPEYHELEQSGNRTLDANTEIQKAHYDGAVTINNNAVIDVYSALNTEGLGGKTGLILENGSTINVGGSAVVFGGSATGTVINGTVNLKDSSQLWFGATSINNSISEDAVINVTGSGVEIQTGTNGVESGGTINVESGASLSLIAGTDGDPDGNSLTGGPLNQTGGTINNAGTLNTSGINSSISGTVNNTGTWSAGSYSVTVAEGGTVNNNEGGTISADNITVSGGGTLNSEKGAIEGKVTIQQDGTLIADAGKSGSITNGVTAAEGSNLKLTNLTADTNVTNLFGGTNNGTEGSLEGVNVGTTSSMLSVDSNGNVVVNSAAAALPGISGRLGAVVSNMYAAGKNNTNAAEAGARFLSRATDGYIADAAQQAKTIESAAKLAVVGAAPHMTWGIHQQGTNIMLNRTALLSPNNSGMAVLDSKTQTGASSGDALNKGFAVWAMPFYQHIDASGMKSGNYDLDIDSDLAGLALGADYTFNNTRIGIAFNAGTGDVTGSGDLNRTTNDIDFWGAGLYFGKAIGNIGVKADISYTSTSNDMKQNIASVGMDALKSDVDARAISVGVEGEYQFKTASVDVAPYIGVRYTDMEVDDYRVKSGGETVMKGYAIDQKVWTFPIGVRLSKTVDSASGWKVKPNLDLAVIPAVGDTRADSRVQFIGVDGTANLTTRVMDNVSYMGQAGIEFAKGDFGFSFNYNYQGSSHSDMHSLFANVRYEF